MSGFIYALFGVLATIIVGWLFYYLTTRRNKITHRTNNCLDIGKGLTESYPDYHLLYKGNEIKNNVMILEGTFTNTGRDIDITNDRVIILKLPDECTYLDSKIVSSSDGLSVFVVKNEEVKAQLQNLVTRDFPIAMKNQVPFLIESSLIKSKESFTYSIIFATPTLNYSIDEKITFSYRIKDTKITKSKKILLWMF